MPLIDTDALPIKAPVSVLQNLTSFPPLSVLTLLQTVVSDGYPESYTIKDNDSFDFIVVGAGSAGSAIAYRLSEICHFTGLLIEAGGYPTAASEEPSLFVTLPHTRIDWDYKGQLPDDVGLGLENQEVFLTRGKAIGGSSDVNYMVAMYGPESDYDDYWVQENPGWDFKGVFPYLLKLQNWNDETVFEVPENARRHAKDGPVLISRATMPDIAFKLKEKAMLKCFADLDIKTLLENNGPDYFGASVPHAILGEGKRSSTAEAYVKRMKGRKNFKLATNSLVTKIIIDGNVAVGVEVENNKGEIVKVYASKEVILSAGAINSPQLLMLSGIGPKEELNKFDIPVVNDLPVGKNLSDHVFVPLFFKGKAENSALQALGTPAQIGYFPTPFIVGFYNTDSSNLNAPPQSQPDFQFQSANFPVLSSPITYYLCRNAINIKDSACKALAEANALHEINLMAVILNNPDSRGYVTLRSKDPKEHPFVQMGYFTEKEDLNRMARGLEFIGRMVNTSCYDGFVDMGVGCQKGNKIDYACYARHIVHTLWHPASTCRMGHGGVVDNRLRVYGIKNLRVSDASIMPKITSGNLNIPTIMIGEKTADFIKEDYGVLNNPQCDPKDKKSSDPKDNEPSDPKDKKPSDPIDKELSNPKDMKPGGPKDEKPSDLKYQDTKGKELSDPKDKIASDSKDKIACDPKDIKPSDPKDEKPSDLKDYKPSDPKDQDPKGKELSDPKDKKASDFKDAKPSDLKDKKPCDSKDDGGLMSILKALMKMFSG